MKKLYLTSFEFTDCISKFEDTAIVVVTKEDREKYLESHPLETDFDLKIADSKMIREFKFWYPQSDLKLVRVYTKRVIDELYHNDTNPDLSIQRTYDKDLMNEFDMSRDVMSVLESKRINPLIDPSNHSLQEIFAELKFGRPAASQKYLQELIDELNEPTEVDRNLSVYVERNLLHSLFSKFADRFSDDLAIDLNTIEKIEQLWSKFVESLDIDQIEEEDRKSAKSIWCHNIIMGEGLTKYDIAMRGKNLSEFEKTHGYKFE